MRPSFLKTKTLSCTKFRKNITFFLPSQKLWKSPKNVPPGSKFASKERLRVKIQYLRFLSTPPYFLCRGYIFWGKSVKNSPRCIFVSIQTSKSFSHPLTGKNGFFRLPRNFLGVFSKNVLPQTLLKVILKRFQVHLWVHLHMRSNSRCRNFCIQNGLQTAL